MVLDGTKEVTGHRKGEMERWPSKGPFKLKWFWGQRTMLEGMLNTLRHEEECMWSGKKRKMERGLLKSYSV